MEASKPTLIEAIQTRHRISFLYHERRRVVEPQCYGLGTKGTELLRAYQVGGGPKREPLFDVTKMREIQMLDTFSKPGPHYKRNDSAMAIIFAQL